MGDWPSKKMTEEPTKYGHGHGQWQKDQMKKDAYAAYYRDPYERRYSMQYNGDEEMKDAADAALYRDPYERKYSMRYAEPDHDYKGWNTDKPTEPKYDDKHWQKTPCPRKWKRHQNQLGQTRRRLHDQLGIKHHIQPRNQKHRVQHGLRRQNQQKNKKHHDQLGKRHQNQPKK